MSCHEAEFELALIYQPDWQSRFHHLTQQKYGHLGDADSLMEDARQLLAMRLQSLSDAESVPSFSAAYIQTSFSRCLVDVIRQRHGYPRPSIWLSSQGEIGELLFDLMCLRRYDRAQILAQVQQLITPVPEQEQVISLIREMESRKSCQGKHREMRSIDDGEDRSQDSLKSAEALIDAKQPVDSKSKDELAVVIENLMTAGLGADQQSCSALAQALIQQRQLLGKSVQLSDDEAFTVRGKYMHALTHEEMASILGLNERQVRYLIKKGLEKIRVLLKAAGISIEDLL
jgi:DNA-directed RNA polymerase specialized sigma24 family protein